MSREHRFEVVDHTADVGVVGIGSDMAEAFENCAYGMFSQMADLDKYKPDVHKRVVVVGTENVELLQSFLSELLVLFDGERLLPIDIEITEISFGRLTAWVDAKKIDETIEWLGPQIKAVTYHKMSVEESGGQWRARAIFDV
ncbi:MAG: archease [Armatimonadetes bacterium]|nr:archease [Armatimonadota bacterium]